MRSAASDTFSLLETSENTAEAPIESSLWRADRAWSCWLLGLLLSAVSQLSSPRADTTFPPFLFVLSLSFNAESKLWTCQNPRTWRCFLSAVLSQNSSAPSRLSRRLSGSVLTSTLAEFDTHSRYVPELMLSFKSGEEFENLPIPYFILIENQLLLSNKTQHITAIRNMFINLFRSVNWILAYEHLNLICLNCAQNQSLVLHLVGKYVYGGCT